MNLDSMGDNLPDKIKNAAYVINLDEYSDIGTHWIALYVNTKIVTYFDSFAVKPIPKEFRNFINNKIIIANIFRIQAYDSITCCIIVLDSLISCLKAIAQQTLLVFFHQIISKKMMT